MNKRIVITGIGVLSPTAIGKEAYWEGLFSGRKGFRPVTLFDTAPFRVNIAGEIANFDPLSFLGKKGLRDLDRSTRLVCSAAKLALDDGGLEITGDTTHSVGVSIGTTFGSLRSISQFDRSGLIDGPRFVNPSHFPNTVINSPASQISIRFNIKGFNTTVSSGFCAALDAVSYASDFIRFNRADAVLVGGVEELCEETFRMFHELGYLSGLNGAEPLSCPFDARRDGFILSEGAAVLVLENEDHAVRRGADILARVLGCGSSFDPDAEADFSQKGTGLRSAVARALHDAALGPEDIDCVCACANSTRGLDCMETAVLKDVFGDRARRIPASAIKSMIGESFSASGALALAAAVGIIRRGLIPPTVNYHEPDPRCDLDYVAGAAREMKARNVLVTSADPCGQNSAVIVGR